jgi:hypothetical protein
MCNGAGQTKDREHTILPGVCQPLYFGGDYRRRPAENPDTARNFNTNLILCNIFTSEVKELRRFFTPPDMPPRSRVPAR